VQIATIVPTPYLEYVKDDNYHLCLIQELRKKGYYYEFYSRAAKEGKFVIVDNGAAEGATSDIEEVLLYTMTMGATELQLPDFFFDGIETMKAVEKALKYLEEYNYSGKVMAIPQGKDIEDWNICLVEMLKHPQITTIGLPKNMVFLGGALARVQAVRALIDYKENSGREIDIHLLGCWTTPKEVGVINEHYGSYVRGVDSGIAAIYAQGGLVLEDGVEKPGGNKKYLDFDGTSLDEKLLQENIQRWRDYINGVL